MPLRTYFQTSVLMLPTGGHLAMPVELDFTENVNGGAAVFDLEAELMQEGGLGFAQGIFIDNGANNDNLTLTFANTSNQGYVLRIAGKVQTWQPLLVPVGVARFTAVSVVAAARKVQLHFVNYPVAPLMWNVP